MEKKNTYELNNFSNFLKNQKLKNSFKDIKFNEFMEIFIQIENIKEDLKKLKDENIEILKRKKSIIENNKTTYKKELTTMDSKKTNIVDNGYKTTELMVDERVKNNYDLNKNNIDIENKVNFSNSKDYTKHDLKLKEDLNLIKEEGEEIKLNDEFIQSFLKNEENEEEKSCLNIFIDNGIENLIENISSNQNEIKRKEKLLNNLVVTLKDTFYNINGLIISSKKYMVKSSKEIINKLNLNKVIKWDFEISIEDFMYRNIYEAILFNLNTDLAVRLDNLKKNTEIFLLNVKAGICEKTGKFKLLQTLKTKIFVRMNNLLDFNNPLILSEEQKIKSEILINNQNEKDINSKNSINSCGNPKDFGEKYGRIYLPNKGFFINKFSNGNIVDFTKKDELEYLDLIDENSMEEILKKIPNEMKDISKYLEKDVENIVYTISNAVSINKDVKPINICGVILSLKIEEKLTTIELLSFKDSNVIKVLHFCKSFSIEFRENMILILNNVNLKINKNFDIYIEIVSEKSVTVQGILSYEESLKIKKFRFDKNKEYNCIIQLISNRMYRSIQKVIFKYK